MMTCHVHQREKAQPVSRLRRQGGEQHGRWACAKPHGRWACAEQHWARGHVKAEGLGYRNDEAIDTKHARHHDRDEHLHDEARVVYPDGRHARCRLAGAIRGAQARKD